MRKLPPVERLDGDIWSVPVPIPDNPLRYTLSYLIAGTDGLVVVDPGWDSAEGWEALTAGLVEAGAGAADVTGVVVTHVHPDHHGMSGRLVEASGAWVGMHPAERDSLPARTAQARRGPGRASVARAVLVRAGAPADEVDEILGGTTGGRTAPAPLDLVHPDVLLDHGDRIPLAGRDVRAVWTPGHTPGHLCLQDPEARLLLTGDHVLPRITPNIGLHAHREDHPPLAAFMDSLERMAAYDDHEALPAHEYRFRGLATRAHALIAHHADRLGELRDVVTELGAPTLWETTAALTWSRPWDQVGRMRYAALAETDAHVRHLVDAGVLVREREPGAAEGAAEGGPVRVRVA